ncbi:50S ribosomal subunit protein L24 [Alphaproteobacteria bacterium]
MVKVKMRLKSGDSVIITAGKDKGKTGVVQKVMPQENKVIVQGINLKKKRLKPNMKNPHAQVADVEFSLHASNVAHIDPKVGSATRVGYKFVDGKKIRYAKKSGEFIDAV